VNAVMTLRFPRKAVNFLTRWSTICFSRTTLFHVVS
jgi:hypothetical protein